MTKTIETINKPRAKVLEMIGGLTIGQLNKVPEGFNNNIIWNLGHMVAAQEGVCYKRAGLNTMIDDEFYNTYKPSSKPERFLGEDELEKIKGFMASSVIQLEADLQTDMFANYPAWTTRYGIDIANINDAVNFLPFHEGLHIGAIMALRKLV